MSKSLSVILTVFKVAKIIAKVVFILCIVGGAGCLLALVVLPLAGSSLPAEIFEEAGLAIAAAYPACVVGLVSCIGEAIFAFMAERYFGNVLRDGTPFNFDGAKECFRLGIASIIISAATALVAGIAGAILLAIAKSSSDIDVNMSISLSTGLFFLFLSLIFKYGAEIKEEPGESEKSESESETNQQ